MSQTLLRQAVNSSHRGEMPSGLRSQVGQIAIWGSGGGPSGGEKKRIKTKESGRKRQKGKEAEALISVSSLVIENVTLLDYILNPMATSPNLN